MPSRSDVVALLVRMVATSWRMVSRAFFMRSSASFMTFGSILDLHGDARADRFAPQRANQVPRHRHVEDDERKPVVHAHGERGHVHHVEPSRNGVHVTE